MYLAPDGDELAIVEAARRFLADNVPTARLHRAGGADMPAALRTRLAEFGWFGLVVPRDAGGSGLSAVEQALFFRELGRRVGPIDVLAQSLAAVAAPPDLRGDLLAGAAGVALVVREAGGEIRLLGSVDAGFGIDVQTDGARLVRLAGAVCEPLASLDPATSMRRVRGDLAHVVAVAHDADVWRMGQVGAAAMLVGIAEEALDQIVAYARVRETFGRPIGAYQAVRHPCADMAMRVEAARCQLWYAAAAVREGHADAAAHVDAAKHLANQAALSNADANIQLHGGIGVTDEHDAPLLLKHALLLCRTFGAKRWLLRQLLHAGQEAQAAWT